MGIKPSARLPLYRIRIFLGLLLFALLTPLQAAPLNLTIGYPDVISDAMVVGYTVGGGTGTMSITDNNSVGGLLLVYLLLFLEGLLAFLIQAVLRPPQGVQRVRGTADTHALTTPGTAYLRVLQQVPCQSYKNIRYHRLDGY